MFNNPGNTGTRYCFAISFDFCQLRHDMPRGSQSISDFFHLVLSPYDTRLYSVASSVPPTVITGYR